MQVKPSRIRIVLSAVLFIGTAFFLLNCATSAHLIAMPEGVSVVSICSFFTDKELAGTKVAASGEVTAILSDSFILRCRRDPTREIEVGMYQSPTKVENSGILVTVYGTLANAGKSPFLLADDLQIDGKIRRESGGDIPPGFGASGGGGGCH